MVIPEGGMSEAGGTHKQERICPQTTRELRGTFHTLKAHGVHGELESCACRLPEGPLGSGSLPHLLVLDLLNFLNPPAVFLGLSWCSMWLRR